MAHTHTHAIPICKYNGIAPIRCICVCVCVAVYILKTMHCTDLLFGLLRCLQLTHEIALQFNLFQNLFTRITHIPNATAAIAL